MEESAEPAVAIRAIQQRLAEHLANGDFAAIAGLFTENAWLLPPQLGAINGRDNILQFWQEATSLQSLSLRTEDLEPIGVDGAREIGTMRLGLGGQGGGGGEVPSKYVFVWRKAGAEWRIETAIWNRVAPARQMGGQRRGGIGMGGGNRGGQQRPRRPQRGTFVPLLD